MLVDHQIIVQQALGTSGFYIEPFDKYSVQPASYDLHIGETVIIPRGRGILTCTQERICLPDNIAGWILNNSTPARNGLTMATALWFDPGWDGVPTLELYYHGSLDPTYYDHPDYQAITLKEGEKICQMIFFLSQDAEDAMYPYGHPALGSRYQGQDGTTPARPPVSRPYAPTPDEAIVKKYNSYLP